MFTCFSFSSNPKEVTTFSDFKTLTQIGRNIYITQKFDSKQQLDNFIDGNNTINANKLCEKWFPSVEADIFISHSHVDENLAIYLAGWFKQHLGLNCFIDSCVWGYSNELLKQLDKKYSYDTLSDSYTYEKRNLTTAHVHMLLSSAIAKMIDKTEILLFLNTPNSINISKEINNNGLTISPWIYYELLISSIIRKRTKIPNKRIEGLKEASLEMQYNVNLSHMQSIDYLILEKLKNSNKKKLDAIKFLYQNMNISF